MPTEVINTCDSCKTVLAVNQKPIRIIARVILPDGRMPDSAPIKIACKKKCAIDLLTSIGSSIPDAPAAASAKK